MKCGFLLYRCNFAHAKFNESSLPLCKKLDILLIDDLIKLELAKISHRYVYNNIPNSARSLFLSNSYNHTYMTRFRNNPRIDRHHSSTYNKSFLVRAPSIWNILGRDTKNKTKISNFTSAFKKAKITRYQTVHYDLRQSQVNQ